MQTEALQLEPMAFLKTIIILAAVLALVFPFSALVTNRMLLLIKHSAPEWIVWTFLAVAYWLFVSLCLFILYVVGGITA
jgi:hypothetical protein